MSANHADLKGDTLQRYLTQFPDAGSRTLARMLSVEECKLFPSFVSAYSAVRYHRGATGKKDRAKIRVTKADAESARRRRNAALYDVPPQDSEPWEPYALPMPSGRGLVIADLHIPYHEKEVIERILAYADAAGARDFLLIDGDAADCYRLSKFEHDPRVRDTAGEVAMLRQLLASLTDGPWKVIYKLGNHEKRLYSYAKRLAPELFKMAVEAFSWESILKSKEYGFEIVQDDVVIHAGDLNIVHGHETQRSAGTTVNPARTQFLRGKECILSAHNHQPSTHTGVTIRDRPITSWSVGCACQLHPPFMRINDWQWGFALLDYESSGAFQVTNMRVLRRGDIVHV